MTQVLYRQRGHPILAEPLMFFSTAPIETNYDLGRFISNPDTASKHKNRLHNNGDD